MQTPPRRLEPKGRTGLAGRYLHCAASTMCRGIAVYGVLISPRRPRAPVPCGFTAGQVSDMGCIRPAGAGLVAPPGVRICI